MGGGEGGRGGGTIRAWSRGVECGDCGCRISLLRCDAQARAMRRIVRPAQCENCSALTSWLAVCTCALPLELRLGLHQHPC